MPPAAEKTRSERTFPSARASRPRREHPFAGVGCAARCTTRSARAARSPAPCPASSRGPSRLRSRPRSSGRSRRASTSSPRPGPAPARASRYLLPALESGQRVVVATATKALQEQLLANEVPAAARALGREVRVAVLKGRQNYLCRKQLQGFGPMLLRDAARRGGVRGARSRGSPRPRPATAPSCRSSRPRRSGPSSRSAPTAAPGGAARSSRRCFAEAARARAGEAELVIANHALYFADLAAGGGVLPEHDAVVFDEAHRLEETRRRRGSAAASRGTGSGGSRPTSSARCREASRARAGPGARPPRPRRRPAARAPSVAAGRPAPAARAAGRPS